MPRVQAPEVDLHGLTVEQAVEHFTLAYNKAAASGRHTRLIVIHGWNATEFKGSIAHRLHRICTNRGIEFEHPLAGNKGRTAVAIKAKLPGPAAVPKRRSSSKKPLPPLSGGL